MDPQTVALVIGAGGLAGLVTGLVKGIQDWRSGEHTREKERNQDALSQRDRAVKDRDDALRLLDREATRRRVIAEYASTLRRVAIEHGVPTDDLPPWPTVD